MTGEGGEVGHRPASQVPISTIAREWLRLGCTGFGGPPTHIALLRRLCVEERRWIEAKEFEDAIATTNLLPGPASTQLAIYCAWRLRGTVGGVVGGLCFIVPGLVLILALAALFLAHHPADWILGAASGAGAAVPAVALQAAWGLSPASRRRIGGERANQARWAAYALVGGVTAATVGPYLVLVLVACGVVEILVFRHSRPSPQRLDEGRHPCRRPPRGDSGGSRGSGLGGLQGWSPLLWRWFRDHPADATRRRHDLPLDDRRTIPQRCGSWPDHPWASRPNRGRCRLCSRGDGRWAPSGPDRLYSLVRLRPLGWPPLRPDPGQQDRRAFPHRCRGSGCRRHRRVGHPSRSRLWSPVAGPSAGRRTRVALRSSPGCGQHIARSRSSGCDRGALVGSSMSRPDVAGPGYSGTGSPRCELPCCRIT